MREHGSQGPVVSKITVPIWNFLPFSASRLIPLTTKFLRVFSGSNGSCPSIEPTAIRCSFWISVTCRFLFRPL